MKNVILISLVTMLLSLTSNAQSPLSCQMQESQDANRYFNGNCGSGTNGEWETYSHLNTYIPDLDPDEPMHNATLMNINININIIQKDDGTGNFPNNQETIDRLKTMISYINSFYANYGPSDPISWVNELPNFDSKIRFTLGEPGNERIYFYQNTAAWDDMYVSTTIEPFIAQNFPERLEQLNVYIFGNPNNNNWMHASMPSWSNFNKTSWVVIFYWSNPGSDWATAGLLAHEFGHNLDMLHTYTGGGASAICDPQNDDFLQDVFLVEPPNTSNCPHTGSWGDDPYIVNGDRITNNLLGGTQSSKYISPMQAGQMHRSLAITSIRKYVTCEKSEIPLVIEGEQFWDFDIKLYRDLIINPNSELTINCHVVLHPDAKIVVKPGGKLIIDGGIIGTDIYETHSWPGIQVWGDKTAHQFPDANGNYQQGYLELKNGATIENAIVAVDLWKPDDYSATGGIVYANGAIFRNNAKSVHALHYKNYNPYDPTQEFDYNSLFKNCTFEITNDYSGDETFYKHVDLAYVKGINFQACDFSLAENVTGVSPWNHAIAGYDAKFGVKAFCNSLQYPCPEESYDRCAFTGFWSAISAVNDGGIPLTFSVNRADFINNAYGVRTTDMNNASVLFSDFEVGNYNGCGTGIYTDQVTGFAFEENEFTKYAGGPVSNYLGIAINNSAAVNEVYKNNFNGLSYANFSDGINWNSNHIYEGLAYYCNNNSNNYADFFVADYDIHHHSGIQSNQGAENYMAANTFTTSGATWHFYNGGEYKVNYYTDPNNTIATPEYIWNVKLMFTEAENTCPSHYGGGSTLNLVLSTQQKTSAEQVYLDNLTDYNSTKALYDSYIDGGNTDEVKLDIQTSQPSDMWALRAQLLGDSPHLSLEILKAAADKTDVLTESALFDILAANPDELKRDTLISYLENKEEPLPDYMIDLLEQLAGGTTYKTALQQQMAGYKHTYSRAANDIIRSILNDTVTDNNELRNWLDNLGGITSDRQIISSYVSEGNFNDAFTLANMLPSLYNLKGNDSIEHLYYIDILSMQQTLYQQGRNTFQLDSTEKASISYIANNSKGIAGAQAKSILEAVYNEYCAVCPDVEGSAGYKSATTINPDVMGKIYGLDVQVKPNPANQWAEFYYTLPDKVTTGSITIRNTSGSIIEVIEVSGKQGQKLWDTRNIASGTYLYTINSAGYSKTGKVVVSK